MGALLIAVGVIQSANVALAILTLCLISAIMTLGVNIQWGYAGLFNAGVMGFAALGGLAAVQQEASAGSRIVKAFGTEKQEREIFDSTAESVFRNQIRVVRSQTAVTPISELVSIGNALNHHPCKSRAVVGVAALTLGTVRVTMGAGGHDVAAWSTEVALPATCVVKALIASPTNS